MERASATTPEELFLAAIEFKPRERSEFLARACGGNMVLRSEVEMLVACHDAAGGFLEHLPSDAGELVEEIDNQLGRMPERIGRFAIHKQLGAGGMGCVYLAESAEPKRTVALKVIRPGLATHELIRRFRHEVQVVALLQHPGIAQLYEAGAEGTPAGPLPYFAMEYVDGLPITEHAASRGLGIRERMALIARVAEGVQHAHQKGVIHRDLKPANIFVDKSGCPKILDFGVSRLANREEATIQTAQGQLVGTLAYMSPEQLSGDSRQVDSRTDIYALGVILYELLSGHPAFDLKGTSLGDAVRTIRETMPPRLGEVDKRLAGDPEIIVEKAMAKEPSARYQSALELAGDIERWLADQPILARRPSTTYQLRMFAKRHKVLVALGGVSAALLMVAAASLVAAVVVYAWKTEAAEKSQREAEEQLEIAREINGFIEGVFESANPDRAQRMNLTVRDAMSLSSVQTIRDRYPAKARLRVQLNGTIGRTYKSLSLYTEAEPHLQEAVDIAREHLAPDSDERLRALQDLGHLYKLLDRFSEGERLLREVTQTAMLVHGSDSGPTIESRNDLASLLLRRGEAAEAEELYQESLEASRRVLGPKHKTTLASMNNLAAAMKATGKVKETVDLREHLVELCIETMGERNAATMTAMNNLGRDLMDAERPAEAEVVLRRALALRLAVQGHLHASTLNTMTNLGSCLVQLGRAEEAAPLLEDVVCVAEEQSPEGNTSRAKYDREYGIALAALGRYGEAEWYLQRSYMLLAEAVGADKPDTRETAKALTELYRAWGKPDEVARWDSRTR